MEPEASTPLLSKSASVNLGLITRNQNLYNSTVIIVVIRSRDSVVSISQVYENCIDKEQIKFRQSSKSPALKRVHNEENKIKIKVIYKNTFHINVPIAVMLLRPY
jgi:hypothetical protein